MQASNHYLEKEWRLYAQQYIVGRFLWTGWQTKISLFNKFVTHGFSAVTVTRLFLGTFLEAIVFQGYRNPEAIDLLVLITFFVGYI